MNRIDDTACRVHVLAVTASESDQVALSHIFGHTAWELDTARSLGEVRSKLFGPCDLAIPPVILCDDVIPGGTWKDVLSLTRELPNAHLIVSSSAPDDRLWGEVLNLGAYDVLTKPFRPQEVFRTVGCAWRQWTDRRKAASRSETIAPALSAGAVA